MLGLTLDRAGAARAFALGGARVWPSGLGERPAVAPLEDAEARAAVLAWGSTMLRMLRLEGEMIDVHKAQLEALGAHVNAAPETARWGALCARLGIDPSESVEAVIAAARGKETQPAPVRSERSREVAPVVLARLCGPDDTPVHSPWAEVRRLMEARIADGVARYGVPLSTHNGRSMARDGLEEGLDGLQYATGAEMEADDEGAVTAATWFADARFHFAHATLSMLRGERALQRHRERGG